MAKWTALPNFGFKTAWANITGLIVNIFYAK